MKIGAFVIHGNNRRTLGACLDSLRAVSPEVVAVDSGSTDGSAEEVRARGVRRIETAWRGYGAARAAAVAALPSDCEYVFFLDADERLTEGSAEAIRALGSRPERPPVFTLRRHDLAELDGRRFVFRTSKRARLIRREFALWRPEMIVHEQLPKLPRSDSGASIDHEFAINPEFRLSKDRQYALLWALQTSAGTGRRKPGGMQRVAHLLRDSVVNGAVFRGGLPAVKLAWNISRYHSLKQRYLAEVRRGEHRELQELYRQLRLEDLFRETARVTR
jgi:(heptosyl)LPS beta-1,4-glucosyltransferase